MMLDLILILALGVVYAAGFWCGARYGTVAVMTKRVKARLTGWLT